MNSARILVVDAETIAATEVVERLAAMGYEPAGPANDGEKALALVEEQRPDLVLMDIHVHGTIDGIAAAGEMRRRFHVPVIFLAAFLEDATLERMRLTKPFGCILKPFDDRQLKSAIDTALLEHADDEEIPRMNRLHGLLNRASQERATGISTLDGIEGEIRRDRIYEELRYQSRFLQTLMDAMPYPVFYKDDRFRYLGCNTAFEQYVGRKREELIGKTAHEIYPGDLADEYRGADLKVLADLQPLAYEGMMQDSDAVRHNVMFHKAVFHKECGAPGGIIGVMEDITERKRAEDRLRESEERFRTMFELASVGMAQVDPRSGRWEHVNPKLCDITGYSAEELTKMSVAEVTHPEDRQRDWEAFQCVVQGKACDFRSEKRYVRKDGAVVWVNVNMAVSCDDAGRPVRGMAVVEDITGRKQLEEQRYQVEAQLRQSQKMEALGTLAGGIAHDFNNILGVIVGFAEMAEWEADEDGKIKEDLREVLKAAERAKELVQQILAFSRQSEQEKKPIQVGLIVKEALKMLRASLPTTISIKSDVGSKASVMADPTQIHQVVMNLCTNAAHAMRDNGGVLEVRLDDLQLTPDSVLPGSGFLPGPCVKLTFRDTGHGIDPSILDRIFDPFFTTKEQGAGTGLGLAVVHGIVKGHGGTIEVESRPGKGTTFQVILPAIERKRVPQRQAAAPLPRGRERILVVDDEPALTLAVKKMLERLGYQVECRTNGIEALEVFLHGTTGAPFDLVITDMTMPNLTGTDLALKLLKLQPDLPVLLCTGFSEKMDAETARDFGVRGFLMKPVVMRKLAETVRKLLDENSRGPGHNTR